MPKRAGPKELVNLYGEIYEIKSPTVADAMKFESDLSNSDDDKAEAAVGFLRKLGLPKKAIIGLEADHLTELIEELLGSNKRIRFKDYQLAKMASFYGWTDEYLTAMEAKKFMMYFKAIDAIEAQKQIANFTVADWSNLKKPMRKEIFSKVNKLARSVYPRKKVEFTKELLESIINQSN